MPHISLISALGVRTRAIGKDNALLWRIAEDLPRFKKLTMEHPVIMGSKTFSSIGKPLVGRTNIVVTNDLQWSQEGVIVCHSIEEALAEAKAHDTEEVFVIGGGMVYAQTIAYADRLYLTLVESDAEGDTFFPDYTSLPFKEISREEHPEHTPPFAFVMFEKA